MREADLKKAMQGFKMADVSPFGHFGTPDFTAEVMEGARCLVAAVSDAIEAGINEQPLRAALSGIEMLIALGSLSDSCRDTPQ